MGVIKDLLVDNQTMWDYRLVIAEDQSVSIREVYYDMEGNIESFASTPAELVGKDIDEMYDNYYLMGLAFDKPMILENNKENK
jgi:hypothetical protein